ncbi:MAG: hypothetical protein H6Q72_546 [Firmicutes bacterium]|nr:hypothetical protein [Bacillota bacterium]
MVQVPESAEKIRQMHETFTQVRMEVWLTDNLWHWQWWVLIAIFFLPWIVWWKLVDKSRIIEIFLFGMIMLITAGWMDEIGTELQWWYYPVKVIPWYPQLVPVNYTVLPVTYMLIYQYFSKWRSYVTAMMVMAAVYSWIAEPLLSYMGIYKLIIWKYSYSFPIYILIAIIHRRFLEMLLSINRKHKDNL